MRRPQIPEWEFGAVYNKGDVVQVTPFNYDPVLQPVAFYVCINDDVSSYPGRDKVNWAMDDCDKTLCGCRLRYSNEANNAGGCKRRDKDGAWTEGENGLPFGGFPGVDPYDFT